LRIRLKEIAMTHSRPALTLDDVRNVSPALAQYTQKMIVGDLWNRPDLSRRDRSLVTIAALIARCQTIGMPHYFNAALDNGVSPAEISEVITHLAFYTGWSNAFFAVEIAGDIFAARRVGPDQLPAASPELLPLDESSEARRASAVDANFGAVSPGVVHFTEQALFRDLWLRPDLAPRDRSLVTVCALVATGQVAQITYHLGRAMDNGLTEAEASEALTQLAFYCGWPCVFSAMPVVKEVFAGRKA
jgi:4-carboxymuconolactone decarboxylase